MLNASVRCTIVGLCGKHDITTLFVCGRLCVLTGCGMRGYHLVTSCMVISVRCAAMRTWLSLLPRCAREHRESLIGGAFDVCWVVAPL